MLMIKKSILLAVIPALLVSCGRPSAEDANGTDEGELAKEVVGVHMLSTDANYNELSNYLTEEFVTGTFNLEGVTLEKVDQPNGCDFQWGTNKVGLMMGGRRPFPSIYHAEYVFDRLYQPNSEKLADQQEMAAEEKGPISGPDPEGTGAEMPAATDGMAAAKRDTSAATDTANSVSRVTLQATKLVEQATSQAGFVAVTGVGDKAVWETAKQTMHILYNNHILNVRVQTADTESLKRERAVTLAKVILDQMNH